MFRYAVPQTGARRLQSSDSLPSSGRLLRLQFAGPEEQPTMFSGFSRNTTGLLPGSIREASTRRGVMADSRPDPTRFRARGPTRVGPLRPCAGRASKGRSMTSGLAAMSWSGRGGIVAGCWNVSSRKDIVAMRLRASLQPADAKEPWLCSLRSGRDIGNS